MNWGSGRQSKVLLVFQVVGSVLALLFTIESYVFTIRPSIAATVDPYLLGFLDCSTMALCIMVIVAVLFYLREKSKGKAKWLVRNSSSTYP